MEKVLNSDCLFCMLKKTEQVTELLNVQRESAGQDAYQAGLYNGLVLALAVLTNSEPVFYEENEIKEDVESE